MPWFRAAGVDAGLQCPAPSLDDDNINAISWSAAIGCGWEWDLDSAARFQPPVIQTLVQQAACVGVGDAVGVR